MNSISLYRKDSGLVFQSVTGTETTLELNKQDDVSIGFVEGLYEPGLFYVLGGEAMARPENPATLSGSTLSNVPVPSTIHINNESYPCEESTVELEFAHPGEYRIRVESWPYLDKEFEIENPA